MKISLLAALMGMICLVNSVPVNKPLSYTGSSKFYKSGKGLYSSEGKSYGESNQIKLISKKVTFK